MNNKIFNIGGIDFSYRNDPSPPDKLDIKHCHDNYEILFVISGEGRCIVEGSAFNIKPGTLILIRPFQYHCVRLTSSLEYERYVINFSKSGLMDESISLLDGILKNNEISGKYYSACSLSSEAISVFERFESAITLPYNERTIFFKMLLSELIVLLSVSDGENTTRDEGELGARVIRYLDENIDKNVSLDRVARRFFVSKFYLCRAFKKHNGISVHGYINQKRVMYAKQLIESGETASSAAYRVGFGDYSAFYRAYVKIVGKAPTSD